MTDVSACRLGFKTDVGIIGQAELGVSGCLFDAQRIVDLCKGSAQIARSLFDAEFAGDISSLYYRMWSGYQQLPFERFQPDRS
ncbi:hypothetical protein PO124_07755 [Bacillus licheniformis]|nr:hypothetical protein [Bacillus licheniformis]